MGKIKITLLFSAVLITLFLVQGLPTYAEEAKYSFASYRPSKHIHVAPGEEGKGAIYFYNIDGNRTTHITLSVIRPPEGMEVEIQPSTHESIITMNGASLKVIENLHVEPSTPLSKPQSKIPDGMVCFNLPQRGYILANPAYIIVKAPSSAQIGTTAEFTVNAQAEWLEESGAAVMKQERDFKFSVTVATESSELPNTTSNPEPRCMPWWVPIVISITAILVVFFVRRNTVKKRESQ
jgi:hypothetical protein